MEGGLGVSAHTLKQIFQSFTLKNIETLCIDRGMDCSAQASIRFQCSTIKNMKTLCMEGGMEVSAHASHRYSMLHLHKH